MDSVILRQHRKHLPLCVIRGPLADALGERGGGSTGVNPDRAFQWMAGMPALFQRLVEASLYVHGAKER
jgi:hypothetical protein